MRREEHKKKDPNLLVNFPKFFKKCSERWKTMSAKSKSKFEDLAKSNKAHYNQEMKNYIPPKDTAKQLGEMWSEQSAKDKQHDEQKAAKLKEKYEKDIAAHCAKGKSEAGKKGPGRPLGSKKKNPPVDEEEEEEEERKMKKMKKKKRMKNK
ncbi:high mobility group protein B2 [Sigmodon hispidus]